MHLPQPLAPPTPEYDGSEYGGFLVNHRILRCCPVVLEPPLLSDDSAVETSTRFLGLDDIGLKPSVDYRSVFNGWTVVERMCLDRWRTKDL